MVISACIAPKYDTTAFEITFLPEVSTKLRSEHALAVYLLSNSAEQMTCSRSHHSVLDKDRTCTLCVTGRLLQRVSHHATSRPYINCLVSKKIRCYLYSLLSLVELLQGPWHSPFPSMKVTLTVLCN